MTRFVFVAIVLAALAFLAFGAITAVQGLLRDGRDRLTTREPGDGIMQKLSFVLLCALVFYVAIWGTA